MLLPSGEEDLNPNFQVRKSKIAACSLRTDRQTDRQTDKQTDRYSDMGPLADFQKKFFFTFRTFGANSAILLPNRFAILKKVTLVFTPLWCVYTCGRPHGRTVK